MTTPELIEGPTLSLRLVTPEDAEYIHALRLNPDFNAHLSQDTGTVEDQRKWIECYKLREAEGGEYYYVIERRDGVRCGVVRLYNIQGDDFTWGSWILDSNKPRKAALESAVLVYIAGFDRLKLRRAVFDVRNDNLHTLAFHRRFGAEQTAKDELNLYFEYAAEQFEDDRAGFMDILERCKI